MEPTHIPPLKGPTIASEAHPPATPTEVGVVTVSYGSEDVLPAFLESVTRATRLTAHVVVADNLPQQSSTAEVASRGGAAYIPMASNVGYGAAINTAVTALPDTVEWVLISNPDVELGPETIDRLMRIGEADPTVASIGPAVYNADGSLYPSARAIPSAGTGIGHALFGKVWPRNPWTRRYRNEHLDSSATRDTGWLSGSCLLVRRSAFDQVGGFDPHYFMYFEDVDLGYRLGLSGYRNVYEPAARVTHTGAHSTTSKPTQMTAAHHASAKRFLAKRYPGPLWWPVRALLAAGLTVRSATLTRSSDKKGQ